MESQSLDYSFQDRRLVKATLSQLALLREMFSHLSWKTCQVRAAIPRVHTKQATKQN